MPIPHCTLTMQEKIVGAVLDLLWGLLEVLHLLKKVIRERECGRKNRVWHGWAPRNGKGKVGTEKASLRRWLVNLWKGITWGSWAKREGGDGLLQAEEPAGAKAWKEHLKQVCASGEQHRKACRERRKNRGRAVGVYSGLGRVRSCVSLGDIIIQIHSTYFISKCPCARHYSRCRVYRRNKTVTACVELTF